MGEKKIIKRSTHKWEIAGRIERVHHGGLFSFLQPSMDPPSISRDFRGLNGDNLVHGTWYFFLE